MGRSNSCPHPSGAFSGGEYLVLISGRPASDEESSQSVQSLVSRNSQVDPGSL